MELAAKLSFELSRPLSKMALGQFLSHMRQLSLELSPSASSVFHIHSSPPLLCLCGDLWGHYSDLVSAGLNHFSHEVIPASGRKCFRLAPSPWVSLFTLCGLHFMLQIFPAQGTHFHSFCLPHITIFQCLDGNNWRGSFSPAYYSTILVPTPK